LGKAILHFRVRSFLSTEARSLWDNLKPVVDFSFLGGRSSSSNQNKNNLELLAPTMRTLGMMDCLDSDWNMEGE
jgi:hypothetical protein